MHTQNQLMSLCQTLFSCAEHLKNAVSSGPCTLLIIHLYVRSVCLLCYMCFSQTSSNGQNSEQSEGKRGSQPFVLKSEYERFNPLRPCPQMCPFIAMSDSTLENTEKHFCKINIVNQILL